VIKGMAAAKEMAAMEKRAPRRIASQIGLTSSRAEIHATATLCSEVKCCHPATQLVSP
jgi:hypothetical protein